MPASTDTINKITEKGYTFTRLSKDNLSDLAILYKEVYGTERKSNYFLKKYDTAYTGAEYAGFIAYTKDNCPVAYYGVIPCFLQHGNDVLLAAQSADTMTHADHRYKGLFVKLSRLTFELCPELGIRLLFGFPNQHSYPAMIRRLGWTETEKMWRFTLPSARIWDRAVSKISKHDHNELLHELALHKPFTGNSVIEDGFAGVYRNEAYMRYKTYTDTYAIAINSGLVWLKIADELVVGDLIINKNNGKLVIEELKELSKKLKLAKISLQVSGGLRLYDHFVVNYKPVPSFPVLFKDFGSGWELNKIKFTFADIDIF